MTDSAPSLGRPLRALRTVGSTMDEAAAWAAAGAPHGATVVAQEQTAGRGRHGRAWTAAPGESLLASVVLRPRGAALGLVPLAAGLAVAETAEALGADAALKWPNDVLAGAARRKLAGVLAEAAWRGSAAAVVLGVGLNVRQTAFPDGLAATSLRLETGRDVDPADVLGPLLDALARALALAEAAPARLVAEVEARLDGLGDVRTVAFPGTDRADAAGRVLGLAPDGALRLALGAGELRVHAGEVTLR